MLKSIASWIMQTRAQRLLRNLEFAFAELSPEALIADVGSGTGHNAEALRRLGRTVQQFDIADLHWTGEPPTRMLDSSLPTEDETFDAVLLCYVLQYPEHPARLLREAVRTLKSRGRLMIVQSTCDSRIGLFYFRWREWFLGAFGFLLARAAGLIAEQPCPVIPIRYYRPAELRLQLQQAGLQLREHREQRSWISWNCFAISDHYLLLTVAEPSTLSSTIPPHA